MTIEIWHLGLSVLAIIISLVVMFINIERSRKKDLKEHLEKKADKIELASVKNQIEKIEKDCAEKTKELKDDFIKQVNELNKKFDNVVTQVLKILQEKL